MSNWRVVGGLLAGCWPGSVSNWRVVGGLLAG